MYVSMALIRQMIKRCLNCRGRDLGCSAPQTEAQILRRLRNPKNNGEEGENRLRRKPRRVLCQEVENWEY